MINGYCTTNLESFRMSKWPEKFVAVPNKGDFVQDSEGLPLRVLYVIHAVVKRDSMSCVPGEPGEPYIIVHIGK